MNAKRKMPDDKLYLLIPYLMRLLTSKSRICAKSSSKKLKNASSISSAWTLPTSVKRERKPKRLKLKKKFLKKT